MVTTTCTKFRMFFKHEYCNQHKVWNVFECSSDDDSEPEVEEVLQEQLLRQMSREYLELIGEAPCRYGYC